jgi:hypothetical protein
VGTRIKKKNALTWEEVSAFSRYPFASYKRLNLGEDFFPASVRPIILEAFYFDGCGCSHLGGL